MARNIHPRGTPVSQRLRERSSLDERGCWVWGGQKTPGGYGMIAVGRRKRYTHRTSYEVFCGEIPAGMDIDHLCRNRACCNPEHLEPVTRAENTRRGMLPDLIRARFALVTHCKRGHEFTPENTYWRPTGGRACKQCVRDRLGPRKRFKDRCPSGHPYTPENTARTEAGHRYCKDCNRQKARLNYQKRRAERQNFLRGRALAFPCLSQPGGNAAPHREIQQ